MHADAASNIFYHYVAQYHIVTVHELNKIGLNLMAHTLNWLEPVPLFNRQLKFHEMMMKLPMTRIEPCHGQR